MPRNRAANRVALLVTLLVFSAIMLRWFGPVLRHPSEYLFEPHGDGLKNYFTLVYYWQYDAGIHFSGLNYPFGEHVVFTDNQPIVAFMGRLIQHLGLPVAAHAVEIINLLLILSQLLTVIFMYFIGRRALLPTWFAGGLAVLLVLLSPQHHRLQGHYGLAYSFVFPMLWYCLLRVREAVSSATVASRTAVYVLSAAGTGLLHPYHLPLAAFFAGGCFLIDFIWRWTRRAPVSAGVGSIGLRQFLVVPSWRLLVAAVLPLVLFQGWLYLTDSVADRPTNPYGFLVAHATWQGVFLPATGPLHTFWQAVFHSDEPTSEGTAYLGLVASLIAVLSIIRILGYMLRGQWRRALRPATPLVLQVSVGAAVLVLLFACAYPFRWGLESLVQYLGPLRQFRALGRFAWVFYYVFGLYAGYYIYLLFRYLKQRRAAPVAYGLLVVAGAVWGAEGWLYYSDRAAKVQVNRIGHLLMNPARPFTERLALGSRSAADFQAILPLPYYHMGSEKFGFVRSGSAQVLSMRAAVELGLPIIADMLSRTSTSQSLAQVQLISHELLPKSLPLQLPSAKPLLIITTHERQNAAERALISRARLLFENVELKLYELPLTAFVSTGPAAAARFAARRDSLHPLPGGLLVAGPPMGVYHRDFDGQPGPDLLTAATTSGGLSGQGPRELLRAPLPMLDNDTLGYEVSVWCWAKSKAALPVLQVYQTGSDGDVRLIGQFVGADATDIAGDWVRLSTVVRPLLAGGPVQVLMAGDDYTADELLVRPRRTTVYQALPNGQIRLNNFPLPAAAPPQFTSPHAAL